MFLGYDRRSLDDKNRLTVPAQYRQELAKGGYVMRGFDQNLMVLPSDVFEAVSRRLSQMSLTNPKVRMLRRRIFSSTVRFELDKVGRFIVPDFLREFANLNGTVIIKGAGDYFEIWSPELAAEQDQYEHNAGLDPGLFDELDLTLGE